MMKSRPFCQGFAVLAFVFSGYVLPGSAFAVDGDRRGPERNMGKGAMEIQWVSGLLFSSRFLNNGDIPKAQYWQNNLRLGWFLNGPGRAESLLRGNFEALLEISHSAIYRGPGTYLAGITALVRYNFVPSDSKWIPYVQLGAGVVHTDAHKDRSQDAIGRSIEFTPQAGLGIRYFFRERWSLNLEGMFQHISNAGLSERNGGLNSFGGFVGISFLLDPAGR